MFDGRSGASPHQKWLRPPAKKRPHGSHNRTGVAPAIFPWPLLAVPFLDGNIMAAVLVPDLNQGLTAGTLIRG
jgi:hypothetical protein